MILTGQFLLVGDQKYRVHPFRCPEGHTFTVLADTGAELGNDEGLREVPASSVGCLYLGCDRFATLVTAD